MILVDAARVPGLHLDAESIEFGATSLRRDATAVRDAGIAVSGAWHGLGACYETPDTDQVLRALDPVRVATDKLADDLDAVADVLDRFADDVRSLQAKRSGLVAQIEDFDSRVAAEANALGGAMLPGVLAPELSFENQTLLGQSGFLGREFETTELDCANKIKAIGSPATLLDRAGTWFQDAATGIGNVWDGTVDAVQEAVTTSWDWTIEVADDVSDWVGYRIDVTVGSWLDVHEAFGLFPVALAGTADDPRPQLTRVGAAILQTLGASLDAWWTTLSAGLWDVDLAGDGQPGVGAPIRADGSVDGQIDPRELNTIADVIWSVSDSYDTNLGMDTAAGGGWAEGSVRVTKVTPPDGGAPRMVVSIPGTQPWWPWDDQGNDHPADFIGDLVGAAGGRSTYSDAVAMAIDKVMATDPDLDADTPILLAGHSLGGITAGDLASDQDFLANHNVTDVVTAGSPIDNNRIDKDIHVLEIDHEGDAVSKLDFADTRLTVETGPSPLPFHIGTSDSGYVPDSKTHTKVTLPDPEPDGDSALKTNHDHRLYGKSVEDAIRSGLSDYQERLRGEGYLDPISADPEVEDPKASYDTYDVPVRRK